MLSKIKVFSTCVALASVLVACGGSKGDNNKKEKEKVYSFTDRFIPTMKSIEKIYVLVFVNGKIASEFSEAGADTVSNSEVKNGVWIRTKTTGVEYIGLLKYVKGQYTKACHIKSVNEKKCIDNKRFVFTSHEDVFKKIKNKEIDIDKKL